MKEDNKSKIVLIKYQNFIIPLNSQRVRGNIEKINIS